MSVLNLQEMYKNLLHGLSNDTIFYGKVNHIQRVQHGFRVMVDLFNERTNAFDDFLYQSDTLDAICFSFDLIIETMNVTIFSQRKALYQFEIVEDPANGLDCVEGVIQMNIHRNYDRYNPYLNRRVTLKITKADRWIREQYQERLDQLLNLLQERCMTTERLTLSYSSQFNELVGVRYSQYHVGLGNCSYINLGDSSRGFFNIGFVKDDDAPVHHYTGFARHKPKWVIISSLYKENYNAAIRYGNKQLFKCDWIFPMLKHYHFNLFRLFQCILLNGGKVYFLKYIANTSVCTIKHDWFDFEVYYESDFDMENYGLSLYIKYKEHFIAIGNSDYNFINKSLINQNFDLIVTPNTHSKIKAKLHRENKTGKLYTEKSYRSRSGFETHRIDRQGSFRYKFK